jgi:HK97 family phage major capsid protein
MNLEDLLKELQALVDKYGDDTDPSDEDAARMAELTNEINQLRAQLDQTAQTRAAAMAAARAAIDNGTAQRIDSVPLARSTNNFGTGAVYDTTDYAAAEQRAWVKGVAERAGVQLVEGYALTDAERAAQNHAMEQRAEFNHTTANTGSVIPVELQNEIISLIDNTAVLWGDMPKQNFPHQFEIIRHKSIDAGDAAQTAEGAAPADGEQNTYDTLKFEGVEIKKTLKMSRRMAVQSVDSFQSYLVKEIAARLSVACNTHAHARLVNKDYGMEETNKIKTSTVNALKKADLAGLLSKLYTYNNPAPKGAIIYANNSVIWNFIAMLEDSNGRSYFVDEKNADPSVEGHIFGKLVKRDDSIADGVIIAGYPDLFEGNVFDGPDVMPYIAPDGSQNRCFDGYELIDCGLAVPKSFAQLTIKTA